MKRDELPSIETFDEACRRNPAPPTTPEQYRRTAEILRTAKPFPSIDRGDLIDCTEHSATGSSGEAGDR